MKRVFVSLVLFALLTAPASGHKPDLIRAGKRAGPIKLYETTLREAKAWFGEPDERTVDERGCVNAVRLKWRGELSVFAGRYRGRTGEIAEVHVLDESLTSAVHGELAIHTKRYIRVGDSESKVRRKYPGERGETHRGHTHYIVDDDYDKVMIKVVDGRVVALEAVPFEWC